MDQLPKGRRCLIENRYALRTQQSQEVLGRAADPVRHHHQPAARAQRTKDLPDREVEGIGVEQGPDIVRDRKSTRLNSSHLVISYAVFCLKQKNRYSATLPYE